MRRLLPVVAVGNRARRVSIVDPPGVEPQEGYWGAYAANPSFSNASLPFSIRSFDDDAASIWADTWTDRFIASYDYTVQTLSHNPNAYFGRYINGHLYGLADAMWITGNPAYLANAEEFVENRLAVLAGNTYGRDDIFGGRMLDPAKQTDGRTSWTEMRMNESFWFVNLAMLARLLHANGASGTTYNTLVLRLQEHWRRYQTDAWGEGSNSWAPDRTPHATASLTHDDPNPHYRNFSHVMAHIATTAWTLYRITGNSNYRTGFNKLLNHLGTGFGYEQGVTPRRATWVHMPNETGTYAHVATMGQSATYTAGPLRAVHHWTRENAWVDEWPVGGRAVARGLAHFMLRDAAENNNTTRGCSAGGCGSACISESPVITIPFTAGGLYEETDGTLHIHHRNVPRSSLWRGWPATIPYSSWVRDTNLRYRSDGNSRYWGALAIPAGFMDYELQNL